MAGNNKNKGLGIFVKEHISIVNNNWDSEGLKYFISCKVNEAPLQSVNLLSIECYKDWIDYSDHMPIFIEFDDMKLKKVKQ